MRVEDFVKVIGSDFYTGVPDSQLKALCNYLMETYGIDSRHHIIAANEGNCAAIAAGYHLATGRVPVVYMQNSGEGNIINPAASLLDEHVYGIPVVFVVGWRGEPGVHDEPQHVFQGEITLKLLETMNIRYVVVDSDTSAESFGDRIGQLRTELAEGRQIAVVVRKNALSYDGSITYQNGYGLLREEIIRQIVRVAGDDPIISTTGKASRELFEIREANGQPHGTDFLTVGSMGHASSIALGVALQKSDRKIWCIDGDGAALMHMGAMAVIGSQNPGNMVHVVINNGAHETVGGMPTAAASGRVDLTTVARACGYAYAVCVEDERSLEEELRKAKGRDALGFIEVKSRIGARDDLGRPTTSAKENRESFMKKLLK